MAQSQILDPIKAQLHDKIAPLLTAARQNFLPGCKLTLIVRLPGVIDRDCIISDDDLDEVHRLVQRKLRVPVDSR